VPPNTTPTCTNGVCGAVCRAGYADCNGSPADGCEVSLLTDANHCGACGHRCPIGESCVSGHCTCGSLDSDCPSGQVCCSQVCRSLQGDLNNCGACGNVCTAPANATAVCSGGVCSYACIGPYADCDGRADTGCETNI